MPPSSRRIELEPDDAVMQEVRDGDPNVLAVLFERHHRMLFHFFVRLTANRQLAEDLVQEVFLRVLKYRHTWQAGNHFVAWMYQIARNAHADWLRKRKVETLFDQDPDERQREVKADLPRQDDALAKGQEIGTLRRALASMPPDKRELLILARFQGLKYEEIAEVLGCEVGTVKVRVHRAVKELGKVYFDLAGERAS
jgi:RNA polymerase sigma-70 factor (ECF subfamily)